MILIGACVAMGIAGVAIVYLGHRLVILRDCTKQDVSGTLAPMAMFIPDQATEVQFASRPGRLWFYTRFRCDEMTFRNWFDAMGFKLKDVNQVTNTQTFDYYYELPSRTPTTIEHGLHDRRSVGSYKRVIVHFDKDKEVGYVFNDNRLRD